MLAAYDRFEFLRRIAVTRMGRIGDEAFISVLIDVYVRDRNAARIVFNISEAIRCFDKQQVEKAIETYFADKNFYHAREEKQELLDKLIERNELSPGESSTPGDSRPPRASPAGGRPASVSSRTAPITSTSRNTSPCWATSRFPRFCVCGWPRRWRGSTSRCGAMKSPMPDANCSPAATVHRNWPKRCSA